MAGTGSAAALAVTAVLMAASGARATTPGGGHVIGAASSSYSQTVHDDAALGTYGASGSGPGIFHSNAPDGDASTAIAYSAAPYVSARVHDTHASGGGTATASLTYEYDIVAHSLSAYNGLKSVIATNGGVPFAGQVRLTSAIDGSATAYVSAGSPAGTFNFSCSHGLMGSCGTSHFNGVAAVSNDDADLTFFGSVTMTATAILLEGSAQSNAFVDPVFSLPLGFSLADFTILLSPGVGNATGATDPLAPSGGPCLPGTICPPPPPPGGVPEPASWALLIAGFGLTGAAQRLALRRRGLRAA